MLKLIGGPFDGTVVDDTYEPGTKVNFRVPTLSQFRKVNPDDDIRESAKQLNARYLVQDDGTATFIDEVSFVDPAVEDACRKLAPFVAKLRNPQ